MTMGFFCSKLIPACRSLPPTWIRPSSSTNTANDYNELFRGSGLSSDKQRNSVGKASRCTQRRMVFSALSSSVVFNGITFMLPLQLSANLEQNATILQILGYNEYLCQICNGGAIVRTIATVLLSEWSFSRSSWYDGGFPSLNQDGPFHHN